MDTAPRASQIKRVPEERRTRGLFQIKRWPSEEDAITARGGKGEDEDVRGQDPLLLYARRSDVDLVSC